MRRIRNAQAAGTWEGLRDVVIDLQTIVAPYYSAQGAAYTTQGTAAHEIVIATSSSANDQTLHATPTDGDIVTVKQQGAGVVTLATADSATIDGVASIVYPVRYYGLTVMYTDAAAEWSIIHKVLPNTVFVS